MPSWVNHRQNLLSRQSLVPLAWRAASKPPRRRCSQGTGCRGPGAMVERGAGARK
ncbi:MAG: hypothetical protein OZSIB_3061 [Candidatus Ozemobacter sibiricus]|uniref:Uncharacterized protein n=1 Tax=Candidatus Ozemobacter sibiricus TaxID=2268124 RepID=A0A367ZGL5_9BACT|nr:MAG: hypothetical protein OZSIB_3061 [Candidatus Ozemobacter sibiricus]